ncbi:hypothetical protein Tco_0540454 [Tanacetum coccineum]
MNTMFTTQSILGKPPSSSYKPKLYYVTPFPKSSVLPKVDKTNALSKPVTSNSAPSTRESKVVQTVIVIAPRIFRTNPSKTSRQQANSDSNDFSSTRVNNTAKTRRPYPRSNSNTDRVPSKSKSSCLLNNLEKIEENHRNSQIPKNQKHMSSECSNITLAIRNAKSEIVCVMCKKCLVTANHDVYVLNYVNDMNSRANNQSANVSIRENQKKHKANAKKSKELGSKGSLASSRPSKPRTCLRWILTGRIFAMCGKLTASSNTENKSKKSMCDNASTSNPSEPSSKGFPISTSLLGRKKDQLVLSILIIYPDSMNYLLDYDKTIILLRLGFVLPIWPSYSSTITPALTTDDKREGPREEEQVFMDDLERLKRQEKEANEEAEALRKKFEHLVIKEGAARTCSSIIFSTVSTPAKASSTNLVNTVSIPVSTASPYEGLSLSDPTNPEEDDSEIPPLEDIYQNSTDGIFTTSSYDDEGAVADFTNLETVVNVSGRFQRSSHLSAVQRIFRQSTTGEARYVASASCCGHGFVDSNQMHYAFSLLIIHSTFYIAIISLFTTISLPSKMAVLDSCPKHNMVAYLEKTEGNVEFHEIIDFLKRSSIHYALTVSSIVSTTFVEQFWTSAKSKTINNVRHITAKVAGKAVSISKASIRSDLLFDDADRIDTLPNQAIFDAIQQMGYEGDLTVLTFNKALFSPQWRFLFHTINHCLSSKSTSWDQVPTNIATAVICLTSNQKYNFSKLIFDGMIRHLDAKKKFVMYPRFISIFLGKQLANVSVPLDHFPVHNLTSKVFSFMVKKGKHFSGKVTPLFATMLVQPTQDEGASSERPSEALPTPSPAPTSEVPYEPHTDSSPAHTSEVPIEHQPDPSPRPSPTATIPDSIPESFGENLGGHSSSDKSLSGNEGDMTIQGVYDLCLSLCKQVSDQAKEIQALKAQITKLKKQAKPVIKHHKAYLKSVSLQQRFPRKSFSKKHRVHKESVSKQGRKIAKGESSVQRDPLFDVMPEDTLDHMETENAQSEGRTRNIVDEDKEIDEVRLSTEDVVSTDKEGVSTDFEKVSTDRPIVSTDGSKVSTDEQVEGTEEHNEGTEEIFEGTEEQREGTEEKVESTAGQIKGTKDHTEEGSATQATQTPTSTIFGDDETIAKVILNMSQAKAVSREKEKGVELKDIEETDRPRPTSTRSLLTLKPLPKIDPKDKGKKKIEEEDESESESDGIPEAEKKFKQLESDEEMARKIQEEWEGEEERNRIAEEKATNEALISNFDDIKARIKADRLLAEKLQEQEREQFTIEERAKFLHDTIAAQRKFLAQQRSEAIRNRPPTKNQLRNQMMTYLKHVGNFKHAELKIKKFEEVQALYEKIKRSDEDFISIGSAEDERLIKRMNEKGVDSSKGEVIKEEIKKKPRKRIKEKKVSERENLVLGKR